jgi:hypothetical protein
MTALAGNGQRAAALQLFEDLRQRLTSQLGLSPGAEVCAAQRRVLRDEIPSACRSPEGLALTGVEDLERVQRAAHRGLQGEGTGVQFPAHAIPFEEPDAMFAGDGAS